MSTSEEDDFVGIKSPTHTHTHTHTYTHTHTHTHTHPKLFTPHLTLPSITWSMLPLL